jgi:hypothetical protein
MLLLSKPALLVGQVSLLLGVQLPTTFYQVTINFVSKVIFTRAIIYGKKGVTPLY